MATLRVSYDYLKSLRTFLALSSRLECDACTVIKRCYFDVSTGLRFFKICHSAYVNHNRRGYDADDCKVSMLRPHGNGDLDIRCATKTHRKVYVTEA